MSNSEGAAKMRIWGAYTPNVVLFLGLNQKWEASMVASNAREVLRKENELLDELIRTSSEFTRNLTGAEADILNGWVAYFKGWRDINEECIGMTDNKLKAHLDAETKRGKKYVAGSTGTTTAAKFHKKNFDADLNAVKKLLT
jgi:CRISPR/Cas system Type II protein with McrA/HNH and RuvC-like nuclease domain